jgi:acetyltransferase-like isoleucine patch superfamily enzyme
MLGRTDHDFRRVGIPVRFSPWIGSKSFSDEHGSEKVVVEDDVWIGFGALILTGVRIERGAVVAAGSVVTRSVSAYSIVAGNPACEIGRRFLDEDDIERHESAIRTGTFEFSERGYDHWIVKPGKDHSLAAKLL